MVHTMHESLYKTVRTNLAARITRGELRPGDRLPAERDLAAEFGVTRTVIRQAIAGLTRDGMVVSAYPRGYHVLGPRIPWLSRLRPLVDEPWEVENIDSAERPATPQDADTFGINPGDPVALCPFELRGADTHTPWALALASYPLEAFNDATRTLLLSSGFIDDDQLERVSGRRIVGHHERIRARLPTAHESERLEIAVTQPILAITRTARTTTTPIAQLTVAARTDHFEVDYLIDA
jgi:DNA-binding GntR family transcriptional regulator